jgi:hypothetical protein
MVRKVDREWKRSSDGHSRYARVREIGDKDSGAVAKRRERGEGVADRDRRIGRDFWSQVEN